jgi:hypothetical protein
MPRVKIPANGVTRAREMLSNQWGGGSGGAFAPRGLSNLAKPAHYSLHILHTRHIWEMAPSACAIRIVVIRAACDHHLFMNVGCREPLSA